MNYFFSIILLFFLFVEHSQAVIIRAGSEFSIDQSEKWGARSFPSICEVVAMYDEGQGGTFGSGVLISPNAVLTSAHVVRAGKAVRTMVDFSPNTTLRSKEVRMIDSIHVHPDHRMDNNYLCSGIDLAILRFLTPITSIGPTQIYEQEVKRGDLGYVVGYGKAGLSNEGSNRPPRIIPNPINKLTDIQD